ncbi:MAG: alkaline phosphatase family protein [Gemmatimonadetes bacterium]|nr:alkaline phosphatase family protein [Gemmatimonadota bacterium]
MRTPTWIGACVALGLVATGVPVVAQSPQAQGPKLVVMISVDQMRADLIDRYAPAFHGGFRRLLDEGYKFTEASHAHATTETAVGHATLSTGVFPSRSGIVANEWQVNESGAWTGMYAVEDTASHIVDIPNAPGRSPKNLLRGGLADWVMAADPEARVASISLKDRAAITMAGKTKGQVYWIVPAAGRFVTSTYYRSEYPKWVTEFNDSVMPGLLADTVWENSVPPSLRYLARPDSAPYEADGVHTTFPHLASQEAAPGGRYAWLLAKPWADRAVAGFAKEAIDALQLGQRGHVDFLALSFSATDYVGHAYGPLSQEQMDNLVRLDGELGALFAFLDEHVGRGNWVAGLSADHGVLTMPEWLATHGEGAVRTDVRTRVVALGQAVRDAAKDGGTRDDIARRLAKIVEERGLAAKAYTDADLTVGEPADSFAVLFRNSYYPGRAGGYLSAYGVEIRFGYHELVAGPTGTSHGTPYWYDRHVPFILLGSGVQHGQAARGVYTVDLAPTLAALAGVRVPPDLDGERIYP